ncbi:MAG: lamin tail domain-containing protein, partial [Ignavibacteria bacterium]|nr:lamin tail domain-containing protein [Ignavibacteria bacterium]
MKNIILVVTVLFATELFSQVVINEVMYAPTSPMKEWFEIYNISNSPVNLQNWKWKDAAVSNPVRTVTTQNILLNPGEYAVVCEDSANLKSSFPGMTGVILQSSGWNALNNTGNESIVLFNSSNTVTDTLGYNNTWGGSGGFSLEKKIPPGPANQQGNWGTSVDPSKGTPGRKNSLTPKQNDLLLKSFLITPEFPLAGDTLKFNTLIKNAGINTASGYTLNIYRDINFDSIAQPTELIYQTNPPALNQNDSISLLHIIPNIDSGKKQYIGKIIYTPDEDTLNNFKVKSLIVGGQAVTTGLIINEIMYAPQNPEPEWIELYNNSTGAINIKNWKIADSSAQNSPVTISSNDRLIYPGDYLVIAKSNQIIPPHPLIDTTKIVLVASLPAFNNDRDKVIIFNNAGGIIDGVSYKSSWGGSSRNSLERISATNPSNDSTNWITSLDCEYSSPTRKNSFANIQPANRNDLLVNEIMFDPLSISCEWIELYNNSGRYLNLNGWKAIIGTSNYNLFTDCNFYIKPGGYLILAVDTTIYNRYSYLISPDSTRRTVFNSGLSLSNSGASVRLSDVLNNTIDSLGYSPKWHNSNLQDTKGYSLERINPGLPSNYQSNWSSSADPLGGTPGKKNSIFVQNNSISELSISPNPFSPDGDGHED